MKRMFVLTALLGGLFVAGTVAAEKGSVLTADQIIWAGLDYSQVRMIGPGHFNDPAAIFPGYLESWNDLFLRERITILQEDTKKTVVPDIDAITAANRTASAQQIVATPGSYDTMAYTHLSPARIADMVKAYKLNRQTGLGVVFIVDRLVKVNKIGEGAVYVVAFDVATREILFSERQVCRAQGYGFRNYWFRVIKEAQEALKGLRYQPSLKGMKEGPGRRL